MEPQVEGGAAPAALLLIAVPLCSYLFFKAQKATTLKGQWGYQGLAAAILLAVIALVMPGGLFLSPEVAERVNPPPSIGEAVSLFPTPVIVVFALVAAIWMAGGLWITIRQARKAGRPWWACFNPLTPVGRYMDRRSWLQLILVVVFGFVVFWVGLELSMTSQPGGTAPGG